MELHGRNYHCSQLVTWNLLLPNSATIHIILILPVNMWLKAPLPGADASVFNLVKTSRKDTLAIGSYCGIKMQDSHRVSGIINT